MRHSPMISCEWIDSRGGSCLKVSIVVGLSVGAAVPNCQCSMTESTTAERCFDSADEYVVTETRSQFSNWSMYGNWQQLSEIWRFICCDGLECRCGDFVLYAIFNFMPMSSDIIGVAWSYLLQSLTARARLFWTRCSFSMFTIDVPYCSARC